MKYKVGDKVRIKSLDWYNENKDDDGIVELSTHVFIPEMIEHCGQIVTIKDVFEDIDDNVVYYMEEIVWDWTDEMIEGLVERNGKIYPYKIGDRVILKGKNRCATITDLRYNSQGNLSYYIKIDNDKDISIDYPTDLLLPYDNMIECKVEEETKSHNNMCKQLIDEMNPNVEYVTETHRGYYTTEPETTSEGKKRCVVYFWDNDFADKVELDLSGRELIQEDGKWFVVKKKKEYPKTYEECCKILEINNSAYLTSDEEGYWNDYELGLNYLIEHFRKLKICRDAYWKLYGEEMGLGKSWEPNYENGEIYFLYYNQTLKIMVKNHTSLGMARNLILAFPTEEMRDAFYENFKELIEECKELL